ncbi:MAG: AraC family transcriptional regulator [Turicibacter sp.]|nr:AraC family transcriptional regulator [Turicibacter sp.]
MTKEQLRTHLFKLTETEKRALNNEDSRLPPTHYNKIKSETGEDIYVFDFETHHRMRRERYAHLGSYLDNTQIEIIKHARYTKTPMHIHSFIEMFYVYAGSVTSVINNEKIELTEGDICLLDPDVPHTILDTGENDIIINFLMSKSYFSTTMLSRLSTNSTIFNFLIHALSNLQQKQQYILFACQESPIAKEIIENILCEYYEPSIGSKDIIDAYMVVIFFEMLRAFQKQNVNENKDSKQTYLGDILQYIEEQQGQCTLQSVAKHFGFNANYLSRLIKNQIGKNFKDLIQELRFNKAATLLRTTSLPIEEIANEIGYNNLGFFYQKFNLMYGLSPKQYRDKEKARNE